MSKRVFQVTENMRRVTRYEVDEAHLTSDQLELLDALIEAGDMSDGDGTNDEEVEALIEAAGGDDYGEVLDIYLGDDADYILSHDERSRPSSVAGAASLGDINDETTRRFFTERGVNMDEEN